MSHGPSDMRVPDADWATQEVVDLILDAWQPDWTKPGHPEYQKQVDRDAKNAERADQIAAMLRKMETPQVNQALAALEDAGYEIVKRSDDAQSSE